VDRHANQKLCLFAISENPSLNFIGVYRRNEGTFLMLIHSVADKDEINPTLSTKNNMQLE